ncbi:hypothetical protein JW992_12250 [candidate division KSB1 bacterium]|nr:hypothetical protein [candidate division KSB1 bacterium]
MKEKKESSNELFIRDSVQHLTGGKPYIFMIMSYETNRKAIFEIVENIGLTEFGLACIRADHVKGSGYQLLEKIHRLIAQAELVIAEISIESPNVFYEIGYAMGLGNERSRPLLLIEHNQKVPTDLKGLEVIEYHNDIGGVKNFQQSIRDELRLRLNTETALLRDMLLAPKATPAFIVSSPKYPGPQSRLKGQVYDERTFGDNLGILGLISAFGSIFGEKQGIELISAQYSPQKLEEWDVNLYLIGSRKVNPVTKYMMEKIQRGQKVRWAFDPWPDGSSEEGDWSVALYRYENGKKDLIMGELVQCGPDSKKNLIWKSDYGLIIRSPNPLHSDDRLVLILAGAHSLGSGAACLAATRSSLIRKIQIALPSRILEDKHQAFWVLVKGTASKKDSLLDEQDVRIEDAGVYDF